jgi:AcrR family transcriptional regulator
MSRAAETLKPNAMSRELIVETARRLIEEGGVEGLSMRKLSAELGVASTAIYWHVGGRDQLLAEIVDDLIAEMGDIAPVGRTAVERVASIARAIRANVQSHPYLLQLADQLGRGSATYFPGQLALACEMTAAGLTGVDAANAVRSILFLVGGFIMLEGDRPQPPNAVTSQQLWREVEGGRADIDAGLLHEMQHPPNIDEVFEFALARLLPAILPSRGKKGL